MTWYEEELRQLVGGQIYGAGVSRDGYPYLIVAKPGTARFIYIIAHADAEGNGAGFLQLTEQDATTPKANN